MSLGFIMLFTYAFVLCRALPSQFEGTALLATDYLFVNFCRLAFLVATLVLALAAFCLNG